VQELFKSSRTCSRWRSYKRLRVFSDLSQMKKLLAMESVLGPVPDEEVISDGVCSRTCSRWRSYKRWRVFRDRSDRI